MNTLCIIPPREGVDLDVLREALANNPAFRERLRLAADRAASLARLTVVDKATPPASGDAHDYVSFGPYWWPDPAQPDGLPYLRRDGETNPASGGDRPHLETLQAAVAVLWAMSQGEESKACSRQAAKLLRGWFLDPETKMNPHLRFAQGIPGICEGRGIGIIDTWGFCFLVDTIRLLEFSEDWTLEDLAGVQGWFSSYLDWLLESPEGRQECSEHNNHGTWYDAQVVCYALFCGRDEIARRQIEQFTRARIGRQIQADGSQPDEMTRTLSMTYCTFNLLAFACLAQSGKRLGLDLWNWTSPDGGQLSQAVRWMLPYYLGQPWTGPQIAPVSLPRIVMLLSLAADGTGDAVFSEAAKRLSSNPWDRLSIWALSMKLTGSRSST